jgi:mannose-6-phosphate isomerase-like protein (cupin superfamily)
VRPPPHYHDCEEVVVILTGSGQVIVQNEKHEFGPDTTLVLQPGEIHQLVNSGGQELYLVAALSETPARVFSIEGKQIELPWS